MKSMQKFKPVVVYDLNRDQIGIWLGPFIINMPGMGWHYKPFIVDFGSYHFYLSEKAFTDDFHLLGWL